ncbi:hypothetical protein YH63_007815 [Afipia massiliensis]|uniref:Uncharacterized protein n=1 Tax=Afipia massiliensis TaxID=211460 RepID=A0A4U6BPC9_9BRAD|nr:hypothetical protein YH63_007815 [Afipia massiliensis]
MVARDRRHAWTDRFGAGEVVTRSYREFSFVIASEAKQSRATSKNWIASSQLLLAMTASCLTCPNLHVSLCANCPVLR